MYKYSHFQTYTLFYRARTPYINLPIRKKEAFRMGIQDSKSKKSRDMPNPMIQQAERLGNTLQTMIEKINEPADEDLHYLPAAVVPEPKSPHHIDV